MKERGIDTYDSIQAVVTWENNNDSFISTHLTNWIDPDCSSAMSDQKISLIGTKGRLSCDQKNRGVQVVTDKNGINDINPYFNLKTYDTYSGRMCMSGYGLKSIIQFLKDVENFINGEISPKDLKSNRPSFQSSIVSTSVIDSLNKSLKGGSILIDVES